MQLNLSLPYKHSKQTKVDHSSSRIEDPTKKAKVP